MDNVDKQKRSEIMSKVKSSGNKTTELAFIKILGLNRMVGWRRKSKMPGKPDFIFPKQKIAVFLDGCFWHGCRKCGRVPATRRIYWTKKIQGNIDRDKRVSKTLRQMGWKVIRIWEHQIVKGGGEFVKNLEETLETQEQR